MTAFASDKELKATLSSLSAVRQRQLGAMFVANVLDLGDAARLKPALGVAQDSNASTDALRDAFRTAKSIAVDSYTVCGSDTDWLRQAGHFVASAAAACLVTEESEERCRNIAWTAAMNARMARNCQLISKDQENNDAEAKAQYEILAKAVDG